MNISEIVARSAKSEEAGRRERLASPELIASSRAVRHAAVGEQKWAKTLESSPDSDHITCNLLDSAGDAVEEIEVYCTLINATSMIAASPRLVADLTIPVSYSFGQWRCLWPFDGDEECVCTPPP
jgi:hypothetical protein